MTNAELEKQEAVGVPALAHQPALEIDAEDVALPRLYVGQYMHEQVKAKTANAGDVFVATGKEDLEPNVLWEVGSDEPGVLFHVLGLRKSKSLSVDGELETWSFDDPDADPSAWTVYNYFLYLPEVDEDVPYKYLLTRTGKPAAQQINTVLKRGEGRGPSWSFAFRLTSAGPRKNKKGEYWVPRVHQVDADADHVNTAEKLALMIAGVSAEAGATGDEPAI